MGRPAAIQRARAKRLRASPSGEISLRRPLDADGAATVRNVIPWRKVEEQLAQRLAEKAAQGEDIGDYPLEDTRQVPSSGEVEASEARDSGVRASLPDSGPTDLPGFADDPMRPLTYSMYTVSDLDTRELQAQQMSIAPPPPPQVIGWDDVGRSALGVLRALVAWRRVPAPRPRLGDVARVPFTAFAADFRSLLGALPWKRIGVGVASVVGVLFVLLVGVIVVAELTDDLKPTRTAALDMPTAAPPSPASPRVAPAPAAGGAAAAAPAVVEIDDVVELDDVTPAKAKPTPAPAPKAAPPKAKLRK
jgi:hypothetical protein